ncbi:META domain-containing protein [Thermosynechococcaceae cyanobacterium BACA0444]|uniref:META domain-containing protein n=2 Tax=Pseudocalidococcus TaxID=3110321 RepID=A0AAE4JYX4_9CYAN|nr:META domain-containing protein [Pseudocalidococcus azoricus BACA0444]
MMSHPFRLAITGLVSTVLSGVPLATLAQAPSDPSSWLDQPLTNWNRPTSDFPALPKPLPATNISQCVSQIRQPSLDAERAVVAKGWKLFGPLQTYDTTQLFLATSGFDGMCRPMGFQAFVYVEGRYAGTLSPVLMDSRSDGVLYAPYLNSGSEINVEFARYRSTDPLCCPSGKSFVTFKIRPDEVPDLIATTVTTTENNGNNSTPVSTSSPSMVLAGPKWYLQAIGNQRIPLEQVKANPPYVEFNASEQRYFGSGGCNRFTGGFRGTGNALKLGPAASTKMACLQGNVQEIESQFFQAMGKVTRYEIQGNTLRLYAQNQLALVFQSR